jgi:hypothetical protein
MCEIDISRIWQNSAEVIGDSICNPGNDLDLNPDPDVGRDRVHDPDLDPDRSAHLSFIVDIRSLATSRRMALFAGFHSLFFFLFGVLTYAIRLREYDSAKANCPNMEFMGPATGYISLHWFCN